MLYGYLRIVWVFNLGKLSGKLKEALDEKQKLKFWKAFKKTIKEIEWILKSLIQSETNMKCFQKTCFLSNLLIFVGKNREFSLVFIVKNFQVNTIFLLFLN